MKSTASDRQHEINRFVSSLAGSFKAFYLYNQDNKAFDDILQNLAKRFQDAAVHQNTIKLGITNRSLVYQGEPVGFPELTVHLASGMRTAGIKEIIFQAPLQGRHFFQILHILAAKDPIEIKKDKLLPFYWDGEPKPISLVPITSNSLAVRLPDEVISRRLAPLAIPKTQSGSGFLELFQQARPANLPDFLSWIQQKVSILPLPTAQFVKNIVEAMREGYFPLERFVKLFPIPLTHLPFLTAPTNLSTRSRRPSANDQTHQLKKADRKLKIDWITWSSGFSAVETGALGGLRQIGGIGSVSDDLDLTNNLLKETGPMFNLGLALLNRLMREKTNVGVQEKALAIGMEVWLANQSNTDGAALSLLSTLRQQLCSPSSMNLVLFPLREATMESSTYGEISKYLMTLGRPVIPVLIKALETEADRSMRKKLCHLIVLLSLENDIEPLLEAIPAASFFLLRNIVMILGETKNPKILSVIYPLLSHPQKIVRTEVVRSLAKLGTPEALSALQSGLNRVADPETKKLISDILEINAKSRQAS